MSIFHYTSGLHPCLDAFPRVRAEQEAVAHRAQHHREAAHGNGETQLILAHPGPHRRIEQPQEAEETPAPEQLDDQAPQTGVLFDEEFASDFTLDLTANSAELNEIKGGKYTIVEADKIEGTFATVLKPKNTWTVEYVSEEVGEGEEKETVVKRVLLTIPSKGLSVIVR